MKYLSPPPAIGKVAPPFSLKSTSGRVSSLDDFKEAKGLLVAFICNHCPFVTHLIESFVDFANEYRKKGIEVVAISANSPDAFPEDDFEHMISFAKNHRLPFPYLYDESQDVALAYDATCTPSFFLFDRKRELFYSGQYDSSRPKFDAEVAKRMPAMRTDLPVSGEDMRAAADALLAGVAPPENQVPSVGCSITWHPEKDPNWN